MLARVNRTDAKSATRSGAQCTWPRSYTFTISRTCGIRAVDRSGSSGRRDYSGVWAPRSPCLVDLVRRPGKDRTLLHVNGTDQLDVWYSRKVLSCTFNRGSGASVTNKCRSIHFGHHLLIHVHMYDLRAWIQGRLIRLRTESWCLAGARDRTVVSDTFGVGLMYATQWERNVYSANIPTCWRCNSCYTSVERNDLHSTDLHK